MKHHALDCTVEGRVGIRALVEQNTFFDRLTTGERDLLLAEHALFAHYGPGEYLVQEGNGERYLFVLLEGQVRVCRGGGWDCAISTLNPGAVMGEVSFLTPDRPRVTSIIAVDRVTVFRLTREAMDNLDKDLQIRIKDQLLLVMIQRLEELNMTLLRLVR